ncbi:hypothetical protein SAMN05216315_11243 [Nitrosospira sp. Nsp18]|uniref:hypothetical protein n=1 Tax=Nitrosospira sp. Nsp18 TaxID=1855334 RepID=UPI00087E6382|nr:hypothetical protein [Nitrosospira sp. Nsp18]SDA19799.1 hypothetical protein SAMN05216315_11243 [Nitrosospira sp. Nsp18]
MHFFNNQPGVHDSARDAGSSGDQGAAKGAAAGAASGGAAGGTAGTLVGGACGRRDGGCRGGYVGSLAGTAGGLPEGGEGTKGAQHPRPAGMMLAVRIANAGDTQQIIERLRQHGAADVERTKGTWENGYWVDFDPVMPPRLVD